MRPTGTVTLLFSDIDGSTRLLRSIGVQRYENALAQHAGYEVDTAGDSFFRQQIRHERVLIKSFFDGSEFLYRLVKALSE